MVYYLCAGGAHPVRGKDRSPPHDIALLRTPFLPAHADDQAYEERTFAMPVKPLPPHPHLAHLKSQARDLLRAHASRDQQAAQRIREFHPRFQGVPDASIFDAQFRLSDAQLTIARERGFANWARLKRHIEKPTLADQLDL